LIERCRGFIIKVMTGHFPIPEDESGRLEVLKSLEILDTPPQEEFDDLARLASIICETPISLITLIDEDRQWFKARVGIDLPETGRDVSFCAHTIAADTMMEVQDATKDPRFGENPLVQNDPSIRYYAGVPLRPDDEHAVGTLCVIDRQRKQLTNDQRHALEALGRQATALLRLHRNRILLQHLSTQKNAFLRIVGHDLRNPLNYIQSASTLLAETLKQGDRLPESLRSVPAQIVERSHYMTNLISTFLDMQAIEDGAIQLHTEEVSLREFIPTVVRDHREQAAARGVALESDVSRHAPVVTADRSRLRQILENLLTNAVKFTGEGTNVTLRARAEGGDTLIEVSDHGPGLSSEDLDRLFAPYARLGRETVRGHEGRGLGLSIAKSLAELHGGTIGARNNDGAGATFWVRLPG
jgi:signal transduction histidine kinase